MEKYFVTGIDTDAGKTVVAAILTKALQADYWKPVQAGELDNTDTMKVQRLVNDNKTTFYPEGYRLQTPASPHYAAELDQVQIDTSQLELPKTTNNLIVEGAGGLFVPLNDKELIIDLMAKWQIPVILVSKNYLGSINHTLLSIFALQQKNIPIAGIVFNGEATPATEDYIVQYTQVKKLARIPWTDTLNSDWIREQAAQFDTDLLL